MSKMPWDPAVAVNSYVSTTFVPLPWIEMCGIDSDVLVLVLPVFGSKNIVHGARSMFQVRLLIALVIAPR